MKCNKCGESSPYTINGLCVDCAEIDNGENMLNTNADRDMVATGTTITYYNCNKIQCPKCDGTGYQQQNDGIFIICQICCGTGYMEQKKQREPYYPSCETLYQYSGINQSTYTITL